MTRWLFLLLAVTVSACSSDDDPEVFSAEADALPTSGDSTFVLYSLREAGGPTVVGDTAAATTAWDIGFRGTEVVLNGGASGPGAGVGTVVDTAYVEVDDALNDTFTYRRDGESPCPSGPARAVCTGPGDGWFELLALPGGGEVVVPIPGRTLLLRLGNGQGYAKVEFESYYLGAPDPGGLDGESEGGFYSFRYTVNPDGSSFVPEE